MNRLEFLGLHNFNDSPRANLRLLIAKINVLILDIDAPRDYRQRSNMSDKIEYRIEQLDPLRHHRERFSCESRELTDFLQNRARKEMASRSSACFVLVPLHDPARIAGFYTLSAAEITTADLPEAIKKRMPRYQTLPATLLGRLARDEAFRGMRIGDRLMEDALARAFAGSAEVGSTAMVTDPKDERAAAFYRDFGFLPLAGNRLFLPMTEIIRLLKQGGSGRFPS
jgi:GNAT superfamily N-acetyltransferase